MINFFNIFLNRSTLFDYIKTVKNIMLIKRFTMIGGFPNIKIKREIANEFLKYLWKYTQKSKLFHKALFECQYLSI